MPQRVFALGAIGTKSSQASAVAGLDSRTKTPGKQADSSPPQRRTRSTRPTVTNITPTSPIPPTPPAAPPRARSGRSVSARRSSSAAGQRHPRVRGAWAVMEGRRLRHVPTPTAPTAGAGAWAVSRRPGRGSSQPLTRENSSSTTPRRLYCYHRPIPPDPARHRGNLAGTTLPLRQPHRLVVNAGTASAPTARQGRL